MKKIIIILAALLVLPISGHSQYFQKLYDFDSSYDWGYDIFLKTNETFFAIGSLNEPTGQWEIFNMTISGDGSTILAKKLLRIDSASLYIGNPGSAQSLNNGNYIAPFTIATQKTNSTLNSNIGFLKYDALGNTLLYKMYTDTSLYFDNVISCSIMPANGILLGGGRAPFGLPEQGLLIRTDSLGDTLWTRTYPEISGEEAWFTRLIPITNGRIAASAQSLYTYWACTGGEYLPYYHYTPIFMILDSTGNILKDTAYGTRYSGGGNIFPDRYGGYMQWGSIDTIADCSDPESYVNFPCYVAHLDTNFKMDWEMDLTVDFFNGQRDPFQIKQLQDGNFIVFGDQQTYYSTLHTYSIGWAMKVTRTGEVLWQHSYFSDSNNFAYIRDMVEKPDGSLLFIGKSFNDTLPAWHAMGDLWLIGTDSNGCELPGCGNGLFPASVISPQLPAASLRVYPNPTTGRLTISAPEQGIFIVYDLQGQQTARYNVMKGETEIVLPSVADGVYLGRFLGESGYEQVVRVVKE